VHAICEEYRAAATVDYEHDVTNRLAGARIGCPVLVLWDASGAVGSWYDPLQVWREWADDVSGEAVQAGHFLAEEAPGETAELLLRFLAKD
jgi:haloacetate dehalogenase